jgi:hypothetical protein
LKFVNSIAKNVKTAAKIIRNLKLNASKENIGTAKVKADKRAKGSKKA